MERERERLKIRFHYVISKRTELAVIRRGIKFTQYNSKTVSISVTIATTYISSICTTVCTTRQLLGSVDG